MLTSIKSVVEHVDPKHVIDGVSVATVAASFTEYLPPFAAGATLIWTLIRIYETETIQKLIHRGRTA